MNGVTEEPVWMRHLREIHAAVILGTPASDELVKAATKVVRARFGQKEWEPLKDAIAELAGVLKITGMEGRDE